MINNLFKAVKNAALIDELHFYVYVYFDKIV